MSESNKGILESVDDKVEFSPQDAEDLVKGVLGDDAFERSGTEGVLGIKKERYKEAEKLPLQLRTIWWQIENENAQREFQKAKINNQLKSASNISNREKRKMKDHADYLNQYDYISEKVQDFIGFSSSIGSP